MLKILGAPGRFCDGMSRRDFLQIGGLAMGGLSLPQIIRAEAEAGVKSSRKSIIMVFLAGGPSHIDSFDPKTEAPAEIRGEFDPIETSVPGIQMTELFPRMAAIMDKLAIIRSIVGTPHDHASFHCLTGRPRNIQAQPGPQPAGGWPSLGSVLSRVHGPTAPDIPPFVTLVPDTILKEWADPGSPGFLGPAYSAFRPTGQGLNEMVLKGITANRLKDRRTLLASLDRFRRDVDSTGMMAGMDKFTEQALGVLSSTRLVEALDLSREDPRVRESYGEQGMRLAPGSNDDYPSGGGLEHFLLARRLVEAGVRCVTMSFGKYDWHVDNFREAKRVFPLLDRGVAALVKDLHDRGMDKDVTVIVWGEFGRTPKVNVNGGRDHHPNVMSAVLAGGGMPMGQVIGSTDRNGDSAKSRPIHFQEVFATLYHNMQIDLEKTVFNDLTGRPTTLLDFREPVRELL